MLRFQNNKSCKVLLTAVFEILILKITFPFLQIKALQPNHFISHLIEVLAEDNEASIRGDCDNTIATADTGCQSCTVSSYDSDEDESKVDPISFNTLSSDVITRAESPIDYDSNRVLSCHNHTGQSLRFFCDDCDTAICASCTDIGKSGIISKVKYFGLILATFRFT